LKWKLAIASWNGFAEMSVSDLELNFVEFLGAYLVLKNYKNEVSYWLQIT